MMFDRAKVREIRDTLNERLEVIAKELGVSIKVGNATYTSDNIRFKVEVAAIGKDGEVKSKEANDFRIYCYRYDLKPEDLGRVFQYGHDTYTIIGCKPRSYRFPILVKREDGTVIKFPAPTVTLALRNTNEPHSAKS